MSNPLDMFNGFLQTQKKVKVMKKILRIAFIGILHMTAYLWLLPFVILPKFGNRGTKITISILIVISLIVLSSLVIKKREKNPRLKNKTRESLTLTKMQDFNPE
jgi:hypothetical protein